MAELFANGLVGSILVGAVLLGAVILSIRSMIISKKKGKSLHCGCDCAHCGGHCNR